MTGQSDQASAGKSFANDGWSIFWDVRRNQHDRTARQATTELAGIAHWVTENPVEYRDRFPSKEGEPGPVLLRIRFPLVPGTKSTPLTR